MRSRSSRSSSASAVTAVGGRPVRQDGATGSSRTFRLGQPDVAHRQPGRAHGRPCCGSSSGTPGCRGCRSWRWRTGSRWSRFGLLFFTLLTAFGQLVDPDVRAAADRPLLPVRVGHRVLRRRRAHRHPRADRPSGSSNHPRSAPATTAARSRFFGSTFWQAYYVELTILGVTLCIVAAARRSSTPSARAEPATGQDTRAALPADRLDRRRSSPACRPTPLENLDRRRRDGQDPHLVRLDDHHLAAARRWAWPGTGSSPSSTSGSSAHADGRTVAGRAAADRWSAASRSTSRTSRTSTRTPRSASARSRTSPGRACSTSPPAPSAAAASRSARPGTPRSRCRPSC